MDITTLILKDSSTKPEALRKLRSLSSTVEASLFGGKYQADALEESYLEWLKDATAQVLSERQSREGASLRSQELFSAPEKVIRAIEPVVLFLPFELPEEEVKNIVRKLRQGDNKFCLIEIKYDSNLIAGCAISYKGKYRDYSLRAKMIDYREKLEKLVKEL